MKMINNNIDQSLPVNNLQCFVTNLITVKLYIIYLLLILYLIKIMSAADCNKTLKTNNDETKRASKTTKHKNC